MALGLWFSCRGKRCKRALIRSRPQSLGVDMGLSRDDAWALVTEYTQSESLRKHMLGVEAAVRGYARHFGEDEDDWGAVALLHDFDYRSEERRVGKECRSRWAPQHWKNKAMAW